jgi:hypothetical protein
MRRSRAIGVTLVIAGVVTGFLIFRGNKQLVYQQQPIGCWFEKLPVTLITSNYMMVGASITSLGQQYGDTNLVSNTFAAFDYFGTSAIPYLLGKLEADDSYAKTKTIKLAVKLGARKIPLRRARFERGQAVTALLRLDLPKGSLQTIARLSTNEQSDLAASAKYILRKREQSARTIGP